MGLKVLLSEIDRVNKQSDVFSLVDPGKLKTANEEEAVRKFKKALKPIRLLEWGVVEKNVLKGMNGIQKQKKIPENLSAELKRLMDTCDELERDGGEVDFEFVVKDSAGLEVCKQSIKVSKAILDTMNVQIEKGQL
jgi:hypothetical protein